MPKPRLEPLVIVPDVHRPYHDRRAWNIFLRAAKALKPKHLVIIGDFADFYSVSAHSKDPRRAGKLDEELADVNVGLDELDALGAKNKIFVEGNHEDRLRRYIEDKAPELIANVSVPELFNLKERGWKYVPYKYDTAIGHINFTHDVGVAGRNAVFRCLDTYHKSVVTGHTHRLGYIVEGNAAGEQKISAQFGWLGDAEQVDYMHRVNVKKNWALGFGVGYVEPRSGLVYLTPVPIVNYTCVVNGELYAG